VQNGTVTKICHYPGRKQLITLPTLGYWLGPFGLDNLDTVLGEVFAILCCGGKRDSWSGDFSPFGLGNPSKANQSPYYNEMMTTAGITNGADMNRIAAHYIAQNLGAGVLNAIAPGAGAVDLRPLVNMKVAQAKENLPQLGFKSFKFWPVDDDPAWSADAVANSAQFAPAAVAATQSLKVYTQGQVVVGFDVVDPISAKIQDLQDQITALQGQINPTQTTQPGSGQSTPPATGK
jgi:hypothetical protein